MIPSCHVWSICSLSFPYTHHDFELMFTAFWDFDVQLTPMLLKTRWTANHTPRFLQQKKAWIWYQPWPKTPSSTMGWFLDMKKPRNQYLEKGWKRCTWLDRSMALVKGAKFVQQTEHVQLLNFNSFFKWQSVTRSNLAIRWASRFLPKMKVILVQGMFVGSRTAVLQEKWRIQLQKLANKM